MARPKPKPLRNRVVKAVSGAKPTALTIRGSLEWREWVERAARYCRTDVAKLVDAALLAYVRGQGFEERPPER
jgi:hypothetical protein